jgi:phage shock protein PspC (stress-responsive transcriptional regulator)
MKPFIRTQLDSRLAGVCGGLARSLGIDSTLLRLLFFAAFFTPFPIIIFYAACWLIVPREIF